MGRTAESYLKEADTKPIEMLFPYADEANWPQQRVWERMKYLQNQEATGERAAQIFRELSHIALEMASRMTDED